MVIVHFTQLYKAADNSCLATHTHGSRINRACFTRVTNTSSTSTTSKSKGSGSASDNGASEWRMVTVCDNKTVNVFDFEGNQVSVVLVFMPSESHIQKKYHRRTCARIFDIF